ncbi:twin-arginine translocase TatA/TatE family subunit [Streptomyces sp. NPDC058417]|uniref:twin-arginine translocase TatA/TatE family subunit n=1 Tax=unclassified Streptomyces TaxID=2593676 RepID=UPI00364ED109
MFGLSELALVLLVIVVVLGIRKLPELTRSAGRAARIFKGRQVDQITVLPSRTTTLPSGRRTSFAPWWP